MPGPGNGVRGTSAHARSSPGPALPSCCGRKAPPGLGCCVSHRKLVLRTNLSDLLRAYSDLDAAIAHLTIAAGIFAGIGADAGELQPEIRERTEW